MVFAQFAQKKCERVVSVHFTQKQCDENGFRPVFAESMTAIGQKWFSPNLRTRYGKKRFAPKFRARPKMAPADFLQEHNKIWFLPDLCGSDDHAPLRSTENGFRPIRAEAMRKRGFLANYHTRPNGSCPIRAGPMTKMVSAQFT